MYPNTVAELQDGTLGTVVYRQQRRRLEQRNNRRDIDDCTPSAPALLAHDLDGFDGSAAQSRLKIIILIYLLMKIT